MNNKTCVILCGRQTDRGHKQILDIIDYLNADLFVVSEHDTLGYTKHPNTKASVMVDQIVDTAHIDPAWKHQVGVDNQHTKVKMGWELMKQHELKENIKYHSVFRLRGDCVYELNSDIESHFEKNTVYLNSDYLYYGLRDDVKWCFLLRDLWYEIKNNNTLYDIEISDMIRTVESNIEKSFSFKYCYWQYVNKIKAIPIPLLNTIYRDLPIDPRGYPTNQNISMQQTLEILQNLNKTYKNYKDVMASGRYKLAFHNVYDDQNPFPSELSILLVLLSKNIIPAHSTFITTHGK